MNGPTLRQQRGACISAAPNNVPMRPFWANGDGLFVEDELEFDKSQIDHHRRTIDFHIKRGDQPKQKRHSGILRRFEELLLSHLSQSPNRHTIAEEL